MISLSLRYLGNLNSECLSEYCPIFFIIERQIKLNIDQISFFRKSKINFILQNHTEGNGIYTDFPFHSIYSKLHCVLHAKKVEVKSLDAHFTTKIQIIHHNGRYNPRRQRQWKISPS
jgi:hypothetical protein